MLIQRSSPQVTAILSIPQYFVYMNSMACPFYVVTASLDMAFIQNSTRGTF